jgi:hypothetical protein
LQESPAYLRNGATGTDGQTNRQHNIPPSSDNLDIPTFLRRKMNAQ